MASECVCGSWGYVSIEKFHAFDKKRRVDFKKHRVKSDTLHESTGHRRGLHAILIAPARLGAVTREPHAIEKIHALKNAQGKKAHGENLKIVEYLIGKLLNYYQKLQIDLEIL